VRDKRAEKVKERRNKEGGETKEQNDKEGERKRSTGRMTTGCYANGQAMSVERQGAPT
jgi:hypothetical protein